MPRSGKSLHTGAVDGFEIYRGELIDETVNVGGGDRPTFLVLNRYDLEMHNKEDDRTSLIFTSSSEVTAQITRVYYIDKFGRNRTWRKDTLIIQTITNGE